MRKIGLYHIVKDLKNLNQEKRAAQEKEKALSINDLLLEAGIETKTVTRFMAREIPPLSSAIELIANTVAALPIHLHKKIGTKTKCHDDDQRVKLLNIDTGDTLNGYDFKKALIEDYFYAGNAYAYINRQGNTVRSLHYVKEALVSVVVDPDPVFKDYDILVNGRQYLPHEFVKLTRNTQDGVTGVGIVESHQQILNMAYHYMLYENKLAKTGGNKKGFVKAIKKLSPEAQTELKNQWNRMYSNNSENCIVLNEGLDFKESGSTSTEMQLNESKENMSREILRLMHIPPSLLAATSSATRDDFGDFVKMAILPLLKALETAFNKDLLLEKEKGSFVFVFDTKELMKAEIDKRYKAYEVGIKNNILQINEAREQENLEPIEFFDNQVLLGLDAVLLNTKTKEIYTPNTGLTKNLEMKGVPEDENRDQT